MPPAAAWFGVVRGCRRLSCAPMKARVLSAALLAPLAVGLVLAGGLPFLLGLIGMCGLAAWECCTLMLRVAELGEPKVVRFAAPAAAGLLLIGVYVSLSASRA